jgi:putative ubiquitin-RnfH superfamily antitoxin RatB of RatAB toxin-antitoxin module
MPDLRVSVVYAEPARQFVRELQLPPDSTVADALRCADLPTAGGDVRFGIFGRLVDAATRLRDGDRVEVYRPLKVDPKEARRNRAKK